MAVADVVAVAGAAVAVVAVAVLTGVAVVDGVADAVAAVEDVADGFCGCRCCRCRGGWQGYTSAPTAACHSRSPRSSRSPPWFS